VQFLQLQKLLDLDLKWGRGYTGAHMLLSAQYDGL